MFQNNSGLQSLLKEVNLSSFSRDLDTTQALKKPFSRILMLASNCLK
jgi:hypothetical protein